VYSLIGPFKSEYIVTDIEKGKIISPLRIMTKSEVMNDLLKLLDLVQKHADKERCQHCLDLLESVFGHDKQTKDLPRINKMLLILISDRHSNAVVGLTSYCSNPLRPTAAIYVFM